MKRQYRVVSLFTGAGGMDLGFIRAGFKVVWANDLNKHASQTYEANIGKHIVNKSIHDISLEDIPECDVVIGGPPCQGFSVAGKMDPHDARSRLIWDFFNVVKAKRPRYFVMENVRALGKLEKFEHVRNALFQAYSKIGYNFRYSILNSKDYGVPQSRERFILIGTTDPPAHIAFPQKEEKVISTREAIADLGPPGTDRNPGVCRARITVAQHPVRRRSPYAGMIFNGLGRPIDLDRPAPTLPASMGGNKTPIIEENLLRDPSSSSWVKQHHAKVMDKVEFDAYAIEVPSHLRRLTVRECARLQGFPDDFHFAGSQSQQYCQIGNAVPPPLAYHIAVAVRQSLDGKLPCVVGTQPELPL